MPIALTTMAMVLLAGCRGYDPGPGTEQAYYGDDRIPYVTNDGFYDGGVFDQDMIEPEPGFR